MTEQENNNTIMDEESREKAVQDQYEESALIFNALHSQFRQIGYQLAKRKKKAPIRVLEAMLFMPLEEVQLVGAEEKELFDLCHKIMYHKNKITEYAIKRKMNEEKEETTNE